MRTIRTTTWVSWVSGQTHGPGETHVLDDALADELVTLGAAEYLDAADRAPSSDTGEAPGSETTPPVGDDPPRVHGHAAASPGAGEQVPAPDGPHLPPAAGSPESTTRVRGIGPVTATALFDGGIPTLAALAALDEPTALGLATQPGASYTTTDLLGWRDAARDLLALDTAGA